MISPTLSPFWLFDTPTPKLGRLLIVDDEVELMTALCELLTEQGYEVMGVTSGQQALAALKEQGFDLLLTDLMMPDLDGIAVLRAGLEIDPHLVGIIMTGQGTVQTAIEAMKTGAFDYVLKPFKLCAVLPVLARTLAVRRLRMENVQLRESVAIYELSQAIAFTLDLNIIILNKVADAALQQCEADEVSIMLPTREGNEMYVAVVRGEQHEHILGKRLPIEQGVAGWVARSREPLVLHGEVNDPRFAPINPRTDIRSALSMPMLAGNHLVGVLNLNILRHHRPFTLGQIKALHILTTTAAAALESAALYTESKRLQEFNASIVASMAEGLVLLDPEGQLVLANSQAQRLLGYTTEELMGQHWSKIIPLSEQPFVATQNARRAESASNTYETRVLTKANQEIPVLTSATPFTQGGQFAGTLVTFIDITERKRAEEALAERERLAALGAKVGIALIQSDALPDTLQRCAEAIVYHLDAAFARIWTLNTGQDVLELQASAGLYTHLDGPHGRVLVGQFKIGIIAQERKPHLTNTVIGDPRVSDQEWAKREGMVAFAGYPLIVEDRVVGVVALFARHPLTEFTLKALASVANEIALGIERKRAEEALRRAEEKYRSIFENAVEGIFQTTPDGHTLSANPAVVRILGYESLAELSSYFTIIQQAYVNPRRYIEVEQLLGEHGVVKGLEVQLYRKDGSTTWVALSIRSVSDASGALLYYEGSLMDISERKRAEEAQRQEAQITAALAGVGRELIAALNTPALPERLCQMTVEALGCNRSAVVFWQPEEKVYTMAAGYGYTAEQWEMISALKLSREDLESIIARLEEQEVVEVRADTPQDPVSETLFRALGTTAALCLGLWRGQELIGCQIVAYQGRTEFSPAQVRIASGIAQLASLALTNAKLFEELEQANRLKDDILASVSHELRSPLQSIMGFTELALEGVFDPLTAQQSTALQKVQKAANRELRLVNSMLQVSQLGTGRLPVLSEAVDVAALMEDLREETSQLPTKPTVGVEWRIPPGLPPLHTDRMKLSVVLQNLLSNAVKFTEQGSVTVGVYPSDGGMEFRVTDTGIGIAPEVQRVMFEMFRQGDGSSTRRYGGVGLGLYIVRRMLDLLEGTVAVESEVGRGSTFRAWVPPLDAAPH